MKKTIFIILSILVLAGCATTLSPLQRRNIEAKDLKGSFDDAYKSTLQVLQDYGYIIKNSDYQSGVIQGETGTQQVWFNLVSYEITATIEQFGKDTVKERISLVKIIKNTSQYGTQESSRIVTDAELFQKLYDDIQKEMFIRNNLNK